MKERAMISEPKCPSNTDCPVRASDIGFPTYEGAVQKVGFIVELVVVVLVYQKIRPSFSSYLLAVPIHTVAIVLLLLFFGNLRVRIEENDSFRRIVGLCPRTQGRRSNGDCVSWCEDPSKRAIVDWDIQNGIPVGTYRCMDGAEYKEFSNGKPEDDIDYLGNGWYKNSVSHLAYHVI